MSTGHEDPTYADAVAVVVGLDRLSNDLIELAAETSAAARDLRRDLPQIMAQGGRTPAARLVALENIRRQLSWLAGDTGRMHAALARGEEHHGS